MISFFGYTVALHYPSRAEDLYPAIRPPGPRWGQPEVRTIKRTANDIASHPFFAHLIAEHSP